MHGEKLIFHKLSVLPFKGGGILEINSELVQGSLQCWVAPSSPPLDWNTERNQ